MFGQKATEVAPRRAKRKHGPAFYIIGTFTAALEMMLGINAAFLANQSVSFVIHSLLDGTPFAWLGPILALIISLAFGASLMLAGLWTFSGFIDTLHRARAYADQYASWWWPVLLCWLMILGIMGIDFATLGFRANYFIEKGSVWLLAFFGILIPLVWILGMFLHVLENTPREARLAEVRRFAESLEADDMEDVVKTMDPDLRTRALNGDTSAYNEHYQRVSQMREDAEDVERQRMADRAQQEAEHRQQKQQKQQNVSRPFLKPVPRNQADGTGRSA